jgi:hypothetical protein
MRRLVADRYDALSRPCRATLPRQAGEGKVLDFAEQIAFLATLPRQAGEGKALDFAEQIAFLATLPRQAGEGKACRPRFVGKLSPYLPWLTRLKSSRKRRLKLRTGLAGGVSKRSWFFDDIWRHVAVYLAVFLLYSMRIPPCF